MHTLLTKHFPSSVSPNSHDLRYYALHFIDEMKLRNITKLAQDHRFLPTPQPIKTVSSFLRYDRLANCCGLSSREEVSRSPFQRFTHDRNGQIIRLEKGRKECIQLHSCLTVNRGWGEGSARVTGFPE